MPHFDRAMDEEDFLELELRTTLLELRISSWLPISVFEHANSIKAIRVESIILLVIVLPRNIVAKHLMMPCTQASFPTSAMPSR